MLFIGTIRYNLDPFDQHTDEKLWLALEKAYMKDAVRLVICSLDVVVYDIFNQVVHYVKLKIPTH